MLLYGFMEHEQFLNKRAQDPYVSPGPRALLSSDEEILLMLKIRINKSEHSAEYFRYSC